MEIIITNLLDALTTKITLLYVRVDISLHN